MLHHQRRSYLARCIGTLAMSGAWYESNERTSPRLAPSKAAKSKYLRHFPSAEVVGLGNSLGKPLALVPLVASLPATSVEQVRGKFMRPVQPGARFGLAGHAAVYC